MVPWPLDRVRRLRTWLLVRAGLWRGEWRRGRVRIAAGVRWLPWAMPLGASRRSWRYGLYTPAGLRDDEAAPLIVVLHGCKQRALSFAFASGWTRFADRAGVRLLCPEQRRLANVFRCWNWFHQRAQAGRGELDVIVAMIDDAAARVRVDATRVAAVGLSAGGALAALLAFHRAARFLAVAAVAAPPLLVVRRVLIQGAGHAWTGGPGGHPYCEEGGVALTALCARFLRDAGLFESGPEPSP